MNENEKEVSEIQTALQGKTVQNVAVSSNEDGEVYSLNIMLSDGSKVSITPTRNRSLEILTG